MMLPLMASCQTLTPATLKTACDAVGGKRTYTAEQLNVLTRQQKLRDVTSNDFYTQHCKAP